MPRKNLASALMADISLGMDIQHALSQPLVSRCCGGLFGTVTLPGDKSLSHRAIMFGGIAEGLTTVSGLLEGEDVLRTVSALRALGAKVERHNAEWRIEGNGLENLREPADVIDMGNSGTAVRLMIGLLGTHPFTTFFTGDASLRGRPMARISLPLEQMGARFLSRSGLRLPLAVTGAKAPLPISYTLPVASAQVKSAVLLAGLNCEGTTEVIESVPTRDHTERMLRHFGAELEISTTSEGAERISVKGKAKLKGKPIVIPSDISSAAFLIVAALLTPGSRLTLLGVGINPRRTGLLTTLNEMGASISLNNMREYGGEPVADITVIASALKGIEVPENRAPSMIDEYPILAIAAANAEGTTRMRGLKELRIKESDRLALMAKGLSAAGVRVEIEGDDLIVHGTGTPPKGGVTVETAMDHRIAMSFLVLGMVSQAPMRVDDGSFIATSFPGFVETINALGGAISEE